MGARDMVLGRLLGNAGKYSGTQVDQTLAVLVEHAVARHASDIHLEPQARVGLVRYRIDGVLHGLHKLPIDALPALLLQIKHLANLTNAEGSLQEGQFTTEVDGQPVTVGVSILPVVGGEKAVLHVVVQRSEPAKLEELGFWGEQLTMLQTTLARPSGLVLVAGPKHAGKATTLHAMLGLLDTPGLSIATVENPLEYHVPGIAQTSAQLHGSGLADSVRAVLRQDPNIIMLSNLPDLETAELATQTASTGHLVLSGLFADDACSAVIQLHTMGIKPFALTRALRLAVGQRLVRRLCPDCAERVALHSDERKQLEGLFGVATPAHRKRLHQLEQAAYKHGLGTHKELNTSTNGITHLWQPSPDGCANCHHSGYQDQIVLTETLPITEELHKIINREHPTASGLRTAALKQGFIPLGLDGLVKALRGLTSVDEVLRVAV